MNLVRLAKHAMGCRFELLLADDTDPVRLRAAGEEALAEVDRIEAQLSVYRSGSEVAHVNALAATRPVRVSPEVFSLLSRAAELYALSDGTFDITVAPLVRAWGFLDGVPRVPSAGELDRLRRSVGMHHILLNREDYTVRFDAPETMIELGAIGKGYAIEKAVEWLLDAGIQSALIHGGTSTIHAIGAPADAAAWKIGIEDPLAGQLAARADSAGGAMRRIKSAAVQPEPSGYGKAPAGADPILELELKDAALSISSPGGKFFEHESRHFGHVIDPRIGGPLQGDLLAAVELPSATETDALSTALLVLGRAGWDRLHKARPAMRAWLVDADRKIFAGGSTPEAGF